MWIAPSGVIRTFRGRLEVLPSRNSGQRVWPVVVDGYNRLTGNRTIVKQVLGEALLPSNPPPPHQMTPFLFGMIIGTRLTLLFAAIAMVVVGFVPGNPVGVPMFAVGLVLFLLLCVVQIRTQRMIRESVTAPVVDDSNPEL